MVFLASVIGVEPTAFRLGVLKNSQNPIKIGNFRTFLGVLSNIFRLNRLFSFVFSANFRFQNNFQTKIIPKTIPIFIAIFKKIDVNNPFFISITSFYLYRFYFLNNLCLYQKASSFVKTKTSIGPPQVFISQENR